MKKLVVFHPALAPYRIDFFNSLYKSFDASFYFLHADALEQSFNQEELKSKLTFTPRYLSAGFLGLKNLRLDVFSVLYKEKPEIVFCSEYNILGVLVLAYKYLFQPTMKIFTICDDSKEMAENLSTKKRKIRDGLVRRFDGVILANQKVIDKYKEIYPDLSSFVYFPIIQKDIRFRQELQEALPLSRSLSVMYSLEGKQVLLYVGRMTAVKNLHFLVEAFREVVDHFPSCILLLVGEGDEMQNLKQEVVQKKLEKNIIFTGKKQGHELVALYNLGQIFILPSQYEPFGAVVNEALLAGCFTLCSTAAGSSDLIEEERNGLLFSPYSSTELVSKMEDALRSNAFFDRAEVKPNRMNYSYEEYFRNFLAQVKQLS